MAQGDVGADMTLRAARRVFDPRSPNERRVLSLLREQGGAPKADLARLTGLSSTAVGAIIRGLEADGLVRPGAPLKGRVGQPSTPYHLAPSGASSLGLKVGRRSAELVLLDATAAVQAEARETYRFPDPAGIVAFAEREAAALLGPEAGVAAGPVAGVGVAMPTAIWEWGDLDGAPPGALDQWRGIDLATTLAPFFDAPIHVLNDGTAACVAEQTASGESDFIYVFVGWFIGGGVALDGRVRLGPTGNAGALGSLLVAGEAGPEQLIGGASLKALEAALDPASAERLWDPTADWSDLGPAFEVWSAAAARRVAQAVASAAAVLDVGAAVIDGSFPAPIRTRFVGAVAEEFSRLDRKGLSAIEIRPGSVGPAARAIGAGCLPLLNAFAADAAVA